MKRLICLLTTLALAVSLSAPAAAWGALVAQDAGEAYAVYDSTTKTLAFNKGTVPAATDTTIVYTGFESTPYTAAKIPWRSIASEAETVTTAGNIQPTSMANWFYNFKKLTSIDLSGLDTSKTTSLDSTFTGCKALRTIDVSHLDTGNVTNMNSTFSSCESLTALDLAGWNTGKVTNMFGMIASCLSLTTLDLSGLDTSSVTNMSVMLCDDKALVSVNLDGFDTSKVTDMHLMFWNCVNLASLDLSSFDTSSLVETDAATAQSGAYALFGYDNFSEEDPGWCVRLAQVTIGEKFAFKDDGLLPAPDSSYITGADGKWHTATGTAYASADVPSNAKATYYAVVPSTDPSVGSDDNSGGNKDPNGGNNPSGDSDSNASDNAPAVGTTAVCGAGKSWHAAYKMTSATTATYVSCKLAKSAKSAVVPATVQISNTTLEVTAIAPKAFNGHKRLTSLTVGANVAKIGKSAFKGCKKLKALTLKTKLLTTKASVKGSLAGSKVRTVKVSVGSKSANAKTRAAYKKSFGKSAGRSVKVK